MTATSASAQFEVYDEHNNNEHCSDIVRDGHHVEGGCHIEFASEKNIPLHAYIPQKITVTACELYFEGWIDEQGEGFFTEAHLDPPHAAAVPCTRTACDEAAPSHEMIPWPFHLREHGPADEEVEVEFCLRAISAGEGAAGGWCDVHFEFAEIGPHAYELGHSGGVSGDGTEVFCENNPGAGYMGPHPLTPAPTSIEAHLETTGDEELGIVH